MMITRAGMWMVMPSFILLAALQGCSSTSRMTKTETVMTESAAMEGNKGNFPAGESSAEQGVSETRIEKTARTEEVKTTRGSGGGIISSTIDVIGHILALPFRLVGSLIAFIF